MRGFPASKPSATHAYRPSQGKRALRRGSPPLQARGRKDRAPHRASRPRVLREAHRRAQAQARRGREAPLQAHARADAAAQAVLGARSRIPCGEPGPAPRSPRSFGGPMPLRDQLNEDIKSAMKAREAERLAALRLMLSAVKQREVDERITLDDTGVIGVVEKMIKQRKDSIAQYEKAARQDLADKEKYEISVIEAYLPKQLSQAEVEAIVDEAVAATGAKGAADMGKVMGVVKPKLAGRADMGKVSGLVKAKLAG